MSTWHDRGPSFIIPIAGTNSAAIILNEVFADAESIGVLLGANGGGETTLIQASLNFDTEYRGKGITLAAATAAATWFNFTSALTASVMTVIQMNTLPAPVIRFQVTGAAAPAAEVTIQTCKRHSPSA